MRVFLATSVAAVLIMAAPVFAQTVRGRINRQGSWGIFPAIGVVVMLDNGAARAVSGPDGMYYFFNVSPGTHTLQILNPWGQIAFAYSIGVFTEPSDVAPILVPW